MFTIKLNSASLLVSILLVINASGTNAQALRLADSTFSFNENIEVRQVSLKSLIIPVSIFGYGVAVNAEDVFISDAEIKEERDENFKNFHTKIDDYLQFAPVAAAYAMMLDNPGQSFWPYTKKLVINEIILGLAVPQMKHLSKVTRPDSNIYNAFPSGHTAQAFSGATLLCDEFGRGKPWLYMAAYGSASAVGVMRILNNRHWASDVIAGAGFGILSAKVSNILVHSFERRD